MVWCGVVRCGMVCYGIVWYDVVWYGMVWFLHCVVCCVSHCIVIAFIDCICGCDFMAQYVYLYSHVCFIVLHCICLDSVFVRVL